MALTINFSSPGASKPSLAGLLNLNLQFFGGMGAAVALRRGDAQGFHDRSRRAFQKSMAQRNVVRNQ